MARDHSGLFFFIENGNLGYTALYMRDYIQTYTQVNGVLFIVPSTTLYYLFIDLFISVLIFFSGLTPSPNEGSARTFVGGQRCESQ